MLSFTGRRPRESREDALLPRSLLSSRHLNGPGPIVCLCVSVGGSACMTPIHLISPRNACITCSNHLLTVLVFLCLCACVCSCGAHGHGQLQEVVSRSVASPLEAFVFFEQQTNGTDVLRRAEVPKPMLLCLHVYVHASTQRESAHTRARERTDCCLIGVSRMTGDTRHMLRWHMFDRQHAPEPTHDTTTHAMTN